MCLWMCVMWQEWNRNKGSQDGEDGVDSVVMCEVGSWSSVFHWRLWDIECGACLRVLEGHEELVRCIRFDNKRIVSGAYDGYVFQIFKWHSHNYMKRNRKYCLWSSRVLPGPVLGVNISFVMVDGRCDTTWCVGTLRPREWTKLLLLTVIINWRE